MTKPTKWYTVIRLILPIIYGIVLAAGIIGKSYLTMIALMALALLAGAFYCGWLCPFGALQEWLGKLGRLLKLPRLRVSDKVEKWLRFSRYILFGLTFTGLAAVLFITSPVRNLHGNDNAEYQPNYCWRLDSVWGCTTLISGSRQDHSAVTCVLRVPDTVLSVWPESSASAVIKKHASAAEHATENVPAR